MCIICERIQMIKERTNPYFVKELETGYVVMGDNQYFRVRAKLLEEMTIVAKAVSKAFGAEKMNYECLGNGDAHLHWHLFPRVSGDIENYGNKGRGPVWWYPREKMYDNANRPNKEELEGMKQQLLLELDKCLRNE